MTPRTCRVCGHSEILAQVGGREITNFTSYWRCGSCYFAPELTLEQRLKLSIQLNRKLATVGHPMTCDCPVCSDREGGYTRFLALVMFGAWIVLTAYGYAIFGLWAFQAFHQF